jgi:hypothetical protein
MEMESGGKDRVQQAGSLLLAIGVGMWGVYAVGRYLLGWDISDRQFLPYHLAVIIPGMIIRFYLPRLRRIREWLFPGGRGKTRSTRHG